MFLLSHHYIKVGIVVDDALGWFELGADEVSLRAIVDGLEPRQIEEQVAGVVGHERTIE